MNNHPSSIVEGTSKEESLPFRQIFESQPGMLLILSPDLRVQAATDVYLRETLTTREEIVGKHVFDVFPDNPQVAESSSSRNVKDSIELVLSTGKAHKMDPFRYDIPDPDHQGCFLERYWTTINSPMVDEKGTISCIIHETFNVTEREKARRQLKESQERERNALAHAQLQRSRLERLFEQAPAAMAMLEGQELVFKVINKSYQQLFPGRELLNLALFEALPELKNRPVEQIIKNVYETGETFEGKEVLIPVARFADKGPEDIYWNFIYQALFDAQNQINGVLIFALDVTEVVNTRRQQEKSAEALRTLNQELEARVERRTKALQLARSVAEKQQQRLERLFTDAPAAICILDGPNLVFELVNPIYQQLFPGRELLGRPILEALPEIEHNPVYKTFREVYDTGKTHEEHEMLIPLARPDNGVMEDRYFKYIQQARYDEHGNIDGILVLAFEVTEQIEARKAVEAGARKLQLITDSLPVLIGYVDKDQVYRFTNKAYETWFPLKANSFLGRRVLDVIGEKAYRNVKGYIDRALAGNKVDFEAEMPYRDGFKKHIHTSYVPDIRDGSVEGFYTLVTDVTEQVEARRALEKSEQEAKAIAEELATANEDLQVTNQQLLHTNSDLDNFIYTASHDLRAPISNIEMLMEELLLELPPECLLQQEVDSILTMMKGSIERFKKTINNLTEITKLQKDHFTETKIVGLKELVKEVTLDLEQIIQKSGAVVQTAVDNCTYFSFSEKNLRSIIYNLLSNAIKYRHPDRKPQVLVSCHQSGEYIVLKVQDNGLGLGAAQQEQLFSMFRRFHDHVEGSGVGLYMVKRIVDNAGGKIEVESKLGEGTTFKVLLKNAG